MANQPEVSEWTTGVYQFETTDVVEGGEGGIDNRPLLELSNRTLFLKNAIGDVEDVNAAQQTSLNKLLKHLPLNRGFFSGLDVSVDSTMTLGGDITNAVVSGGGGGNNESFILVTVANAMPSLNYFVRISLESLGIIGFDNETISPVFKKISTTSFQIGIKEYIPVFQNLKFHLEVISLH